MSTRLDHPDQRSRDAARSWITYLAIAILVLAVLYPIVQLAAIAVHSPNESASPTNLFANFGALLETPFRQWITNCTLFALVVTAPAVAVAAFAGYALSRSRSGNSGLFIARLAAVTMLLVPLYLMLMELRLINIHVALVVVYTGTVLPFCVWQMKRRYDQIPLTVADAARIDGCSRSQSFRLVMLPLLWPILAITALISFVSAWTEYLIAAIALQNAHPFTSPTLLVATQPSVSHPALNAAGALLVSTPAIVLLLILSRSRLPHIGFGSRER